MIIERLHADLPEPFPDLASDEFAAVIGTNMSGRPTPEEQLRQGRQHIFMVELSGDDQREALTAEFVDDGEDAEFPTIVGAPLDEIVGPDMARMFRPEPDAGSIIEPQPTTFRLALGHLEALAPPDPLDALMVHRPAGRMQHRRHPAIAVTPNAARDARRANFKPKAKKAGA